MPVEFDTLTSADLSETGSKIHTLPDEQGFYGQTFVATSPNLSLIEFAVDYTTTYGSGPVELTVMVATVRFDGGGFHPDEVVYQSALITVLPDADGTGAIISVDTGGLTLVEGQRYVILFNANAGDAPTDGGLTFVSNPQNDSEYFVFNHSSNQDDQAAFDENAWYQNPPEGSGWGDIAIRLSYDSANVVEGTPGDDRGETALFGTSGEDIINGYAGNDELFGLGDDDQLNGGDDHDTLRGNAGNDSLSGGNGDDLLVGGLGDDVVDGGDGYDRAGHYHVDETLGGVTVDLNIAGPQDTGGQGWDTLSGIEYLSGTPFADTLTGDGNDNILWGSPATIDPDSGWVSTSNHDTLDGGEGDDLLYVGIGNHSLTGGAGSDTVGFTENWGNDPAISVSLALQGAPQDTGAGLWTLTGIENLSGGGGDDDLTGDGNANILVGSFGNDTLSGAGGNDALYGDGVVDSAAPSSGPPTLFTDTGANGNDTLEGGLGDDVINGGGGVDTATYANASGGVNVNLGGGFAFGADGNDTLVGIENVTGSQFNDTLNGNGDANVLDGLGGNDLIQGQGGNDTIYGGDGDDTLRGDAGELSLTVSGDDVIYGGNGNDGLRGGLGDDQMYGGANNDLMRGNGGVDYFDGGADDGEGFNGIGDRISFYEQRATQGVIADLRTGVISNDGFGNVEAMTGIESLGADTAYADIFYGNDERNSLFGNRGDSLYGFGGDDVIQLSSATAITDGGTGSDRLVLSWFGGWLMPDLDADGLAEVALDATAGWTVDLTAGTLLDGYGNSGSVAGIEHVDGTIFADSLTGDANANTLNGGDGDDLLNGREGDDTLDGGNGTDTASYANASGAVTVTLTALGGSASGADGNDNLLSIENILGSAFNDVLTGNGLANLIQGSGGQDFIRGGAGDDTLEGGDADDYLRGDDGNDILRGGTGQDRVSYATATGGVTVNLTIAGPQATGQGSDTLDGIEHVTGTQYNDTITGDGADNWLWGGSNGAGVTGNDSISGGGGNDLIEVGTGTHTLNGGAGTGDTLSFGGNGSDITAAGVTYNLGNQGVSQNTEQGMMLTSGFENVSGSIHADALTGNDSANRLAGDIGDDMLRGEDGNDYLYGDGRIGVDTNGTGWSGSIATWTDVTTLTGDPGGNDTLLGGRGDDFLYGGRGDDVMTGNQGIDRYVIEADSGDDRITDFAPGVDKIRFEGVAGVDDFSDLTMVRSGSNTLISWGTGDSILVQGLRPTQISASSFEFGSAPAMAAAADLDGARGKDSSFGLGDELGMEATLAAAIHSSMVI